MNNLLPALMVIGLIWQIWLLCAFGRERRKRREFEARALATFIAHACSQGTIDARVKVLERKKGEAS
jgi:triphosphoribosyl-dephospho-CoA synthetase